MSFDILETFGTIIDRGGSDLFVGGAKSWVRLPVGVIPLEEIGIGLDFQRGLMEWLEDKTNLPPHAEHQLEIRHQADYVLQLPIQLGIRVRVHAFRTEGREAYVLRLIQPTPTRMMDVGFRPQIEEYVAANRGLFLVTGATGMGKSTTLAALLQYLGDRYPWHILTYEDPIEYVIAPKKGLIHQRELGSDFSDFSQGLVGGLRESPDVVMIGEIRDLETMRWALSLAEAGFRVLATFHTHSVEETIERYIGSFPENEQSQARIRLATVLSGVLSQMLLPRKTDSPGRPRVVAYEYLFVNASKGARTMIREGKTHQLVNEIRLPEAGLPLDACLAELVGGGHLERSVAEGHARDIQYYNSKLWSLSPNRR